MSKSMELQNNRPDFIELRHRQIVRIGNKLYSVLAKRSGRVYMTHIDESEIEDAKGWK